MFNKVINAGFNNNVQNFRHLEGDHYGRHLQADGAMVDSNSDGYIDTEYLKFMGPEKDGSQYSLQVEDKNKDVNGQHWNGAETLKISNKDGASLGVFTYDKNSRGLVAESGSQLSVTQQWINSGIRMTDKELIDKELKGREIVDADHDGFVDIKQNGIDLPDGTRIVLGTDPGDVYIRDRGGRNVYTLNVASREHDREVASGQRAPDEGSDGSAGGVGDISITATKKAQNREPAGEFDSQQVAFYRESEVPAEKKDGLFGWGWTIGGFGL